MLAINAWYFVFQRLSVMDVKTYSKIFYLINLRISMTRAGQSQSKPCLRAIFVIAYIISLKYRKEF